MLTGRYALCSSVLVNQFPYEAALIRKDLLPQTLRQYQAQLREAEEPPGQLSCRWALRGVVP